MERTMKQKWSFERLFFHVGSLAGIRNRLGQIAGASSTLPPERMTLNRAIDLISDVHRSLKREKKTSWRMYKRRKEHSMTLTI